MHGHGALIQIRFDRVLHVMRQERQWCRREYLVPALHQLSPNFVSFGLQFHGGGGEIDRLSSWARHWRFAGRLIRF